MTRHRSPSIDRVDNRVHTARSTRIQRVLVYLVACLLSLGSLSPKFDTGSYGVALAYTFIIPTVRRKCELPPVTKCFATHQHERDGLGQEGWPLVPSQSTKLLNRRRAHHSSRWTRLHQSSPASHNSNYNPIQLRDRLGLHDRFDRWRFLQRLLDFEIKSSDVNEVLYATLDAYLKYSRPKFGTTDETGSPELTAERRSLLQFVLQEPSSSIADGMVLALSLSVKLSDEVDESMKESPHNQDVLDQLESLLPDPDDDEDAFKGLWDTVIELNGRESVKINEQNATYDWKACCLIARVLIHYDFLTYGIGEAPS